MSAKQIGAQRIEPVDSQVALASAEQGNDFGGPAACHFGAAITSDEVVPRHGVAHFGDTLMSIGEVLAAFELKEHNIAFGGHKHVAARVVQRVDLHVRGAGGVADVDGVIEQASVTTGGGDGIAQALQSAGLQHVEVHWMRPSLLVAAWCPATRWASVTLPYTERVRSTGPITPGRSA